MRPPNEWPTTTGGPASYAPAARADFPRLAHELVGNRRAARQSERPMPVNDGATTRRSRAKNGAMKLHQSACAAPPCRKMRPGLPRSPQASVSTSRALDRRRTTAPAPRDRALEPRRRRRLLAAKGRERRHGVRFVHAAPFGLRRLRTGRPRPCRRRRTSSPRHSARRAVCPRSARGRSGASRSCRKGGRPRSRRRRR